jgi:ATP-dependent helicase/nuclease subunit A
MSSSTSDVALESKALFIRAGAGAGKTTQLISSFLDFVNEFRLQNKRFPRVVITTFTNKATQEVKERLLVNALKSGDQDIFQYINKKSFVHISTIHGLLNLFILQNTEQLSLPQDLKIVDRTQSERTLKKLIYQLMKNKNQYMEILESYPFYQLIDVCKKALNLKYQYKNLNYVSSEQLLELVEIKRSSVIAKLNQVFSLVPQVPEKWHDYFLLLKKYQSLLSDNQVELVLDFFEGDIKKPSFLSKNPPFAVEAHLLIEEIRKNDVFTFQDTSAFRLQHENINKIFSEFINDLFLQLIENKKRTGEITTDDLENYALMLIQSFPEACKEFSESWDYFMIDEYQDTSPVQVEILNQIVGNRPCFIVGDPQQSIYLFRGARSEVFNEKENEFIKKKKEVKELNTNYRSDPKLMNCINDFFKQFNQSFKAMDFKSTDSQSKIKEQIFYIQTHDEALAALKHIQFLLEQGIEAKDICVLSRKNSSLVSVAQLAYKSNISVQLQSAAGFESKREILDLVAFLRFLVNPFDSENLVTLLRSPWLYLDDQSLVDIAQTKEARFSLWSALLVEDRPVVKNLLGYLNEFEKSGAVLTVKKFVSESGFNSFSELLDPTGKREANIWKFISVLSTSERKSGFSLSSFIEDQFQSLQTDLGSMAREAQPVVQPDRVTLLTVHASKGLEFKHVIILGLTDRPQQTNTLQMAFDPLKALYSLSVYHLTESKFVPSAWSTQVRKEFNQRELQENERVLYVAMTRAQQSVSLIAKMPKADERNSIVAETWFKKVVWPAETEQTESYSMKSLFYDDQFQFKEKGNSESLQIREKKHSIIHTENSGHSVTEMISNKTEARASQVSFDKNINSLKKAQKGTDLHRLFESLKYLTFEELGPQLTATEKSLIEYLLNQKEVNLKEILEKGFNEWGFGLKTADGVLQGQIDAWGELEHEIHILDYKTGSSEHSEKAFEQLSIYTHALIRMKKISTDKPIIHSVIYPVDQKIVQKKYVNAEDFLKKEFKFNELFLGKNN